MSDNKQKYHCLADQLRNKIISSDWLPSTKIPTERVLSHEFEVTRVTVRRALRVLENEGIIRRMQGSGTYVNPRRSHRIPLMIDYAGTMSSHAPALHRKLLCRKVISSSEYLSVELNIKPASNILYAERIDFNDTTPVAYDQVYIAEQFSYNLTEKALETINFTERWMESGGFQIINCRQLIEAFSADSACEKNLNLKKNAPVLKSTEFYYVAGGLIGGMFISYYHPEHICISSEFNWKGGISNEH